MLGQLKLKSPLVGGGSWGLGGRVQEAGWLILGGRSSLKKVALYPPLPSPPIPGAPLVPGRQDQLPVGEEEL